MGDSRRVNMMGHVIILHDIPTHTVALLFQKRLVGSRVWGTCMNPKSSTSVDARYVIN